MLVGVPGSGKTTFREENFPKHEYTHVSLDDIIMKIATMFQRKYDDIFLLVADFAKNQMMQNAQLAIEQNKDIIWDQTNLTPESRMGKLSIFPSTYRKIAYVFYTPADHIHRARLETANRHKFIPPKVVQSMIDSYVVPTFGEGFDEIRYKNVEII
jgi:predicted kinase